MKSKAIAPISGPGGLTHFYDNGGILRFEGTNSNTYGGTTILAHSGLVLNTSVALALGRLVRLLSSSTT